MPVETLLSTGIGRPLSFAVGAFDTTRDNINLGQYLTALTKVLESNSSTETSTEWHQQASFHSYLLEINQNGLHY